MGKEFSTDGILISEIRVPSWLPVHRLACHMQEFLIQIMAAELIAMPGVKAFTQLVTFPTRQMEQSTDIPMNFVAHPAPQPLLPALVFYTEYNGSKL
jgi:hypothetical protein